jgi:hypothetical protein
MYVNRVPIEQASRLVSSSNEYYGSRQHEYTAEAVSAGVERHSDTLGMRNLTRAGDSTECSSIGSYLSAASLEDEIEGLMSSQWNERNEDHNDRRVDRDREIEFHTGIDMSRDNNRGIPGIRAVQVRRVEPVCGKVKMQQNESSARNSELAEETLLASLVEKWTWPHRKHGMQAEDFDMNTSELVDEECQTSAATLEFVCSSIKKTLTQDTEAKQIKTYSTSQSGATDTGK